jgi:aminotransferase EvaB
MPFHKNYLPEQYIKTNQSRINHNYLQNQFSDYKNILKKIEPLIINGDFTLGEEVNRFEENFASICNVKHAIGVGSGTDALFLGLKSLGVGAGDEVITTPYTFFATIGAIVTTGAKPVFVDIDLDYNMDPSKIESAITSKTKVILPVHWSGNICKMDEINFIAKKNNLFIVEDACHAIMAENNKIRAGSFGDLGCFSMHPLKNLNVWGDGGVITTNSEELSKKLSLMRNHGLINRNECEIFSYNSRLDTIQAIVANHMLEKISHITDSRISNAAYLDKYLSSLSGITIPPRSKNNKQVFHLYILRTIRRDALVKFLNENDIDAKIHYPIPMHLQPAARNFGYKKGDFPMCEEICNTVFSLPVHEFITKEDCHYMIEKIGEFFEKA